MRKGTRFSALIVGGHQERSRRAGTENVPGIIGLGKACELAVYRTEEENSRVKELRDRLELSILYGVPYSRVNGGDAARLPNTSNISFECVEGEAILLHLDEFGICASTGSACSSGSLEPSHVLLGMGVSPTTAQGSIRFSLGIYNTREEIDTVSEIVPGIITRLRSISPLWAALKGARLTASGMTASGRTA